MTRAEATRKPARCARYAAFAQGAVLLTILGIVIGVTSVISVAAIIDGLNGYIQAQGRILRRRGRTGYRGYPFGPRSVAYPRSIRLRKVHPVSRMRNFCGTVPIDRLRDDLRHAGLLHSGDSNDIRYLRQRSRANYSSRRRTGIRRRDTPFFSERRDDFFPAIDEEHYAPSSASAQRVADSLFPIDPIGKVVQHERPTVRSDRCISRQDPGHIRRPWRGPVRHDPVQPFFRKRYPGIEGTHSWRSQYRKDVDPEPAQRRSRTKRCDARGA